MKYVPTNFKFSFKSIQRSLVSQNILASFFQENNQLPLTLFVGICCSSFLQVVRLLINASTSCTAGSTYLESTISMHNTFHETCILSIFSSSFLFFLFIRHTSILFLSSTLAYISRIPCIFSSLYALFSYLSVLFCVSPSKIFFFNFSKLFILNFIIQFLFYYEYGVKFYFLL